MNFSAWAIKRPIPSILTFFLFCVAGLAGFKSLPIQNLPDLDFPTVIVTANLPGATPSTLETEVTRRIEDSLAAISGIRHIISKVSDGTSISTVQFELEKDPQEAVSDIRNGIEKIRSQLPADMEEPTISRMSVTGDAILTLALHSASLDEAELSWFVDNQISKTLLSVTGVGEVTRVGGLEREIRVELDPVQLNGLNVTAADISSRLQQVLRELPGGLSNIGGQEQAIRTLSGFHRVADIQALMIPLPNGNRVRLDSIAQVKDTAAERRQLALLDGQPVVSLQIKRARGASEVETAERVRDAVNVLREQYPYVDIREINNTIGPVINNYEGAMGALYEGAILAVLAVWLFLRDWRATLVASVALPLSIIPTFALLAVMDFQLNSITLLALTLIIGVLVDDAIVEIENIERHLQNGATPQKAALEAANEIGLAVIATSFTLVAVFLPTAFMTGMAGKFFSQFGWTASIAVLFSLAVARLLTPMMASKLMRAKPHQQAQPDGPIMRRYMRSVHWSLNNPWKTFALAIVFLFASAAILAQLPTNFVDADDKEQIIINLETAPGSTAAQTARVAQQAQRLISAYPEVISVYTTVGIGSSGMMNGGSSSGNVRSARIIAQLTPLAEQTRRSQQTLEALMRIDLEQVPAAKFSFGVEGAGQQLKLVLQSDDAEKLQQAATSVVSELRTLPGLGNINSSASLLRPEVAILVDYDKAARLGVNAATISQAVRVATNSDYDQNLPRLNLPNRQIYVRTRLAQEQRQNLEVIRNLRIAANNGYVPLSSIAEVKLMDGPAQIERLDRKRSVNITIDTLNRPLGEVTQQVEALAALRHLPAGVEQVTSGDAEQQKELFSGFGLAMLAGVLCVYAVLVILFDDFLQPVTILTALPLSAGGAFAALALCGYSLSLSSLIGMIMLMGIVSKNSILLVEFAILSRHRGLNRREAIIDACHKRARPIVMTTFAMVAGMLPMALQLGVPSAFRGPMAIAVIGGLITSTALSLLVVPAVYEKVDGLKHRCLKLLRLRQGMHPMQPARDTH